MSSGFSRHSSIHHLRELLPSFLKKMGARYSQRPDQVIAAWSEVIGPTLAPMARATTFVDAVLEVRVQNSTLLSLLSGPEKLVLLKKLRQRVPEATIQGISLRLG